MWKCKHATGEGTFEAVKERPKLLLLLGLKLKCNHSYRLTNRCMSASVLPSLSILPAVFTEQLVALAAIGAVNKMSEEMLSFIVSFMNSTLALWTKRAIVYHGRNHKVRQAGLDVGILGRRQKTKQKKNMSEKRKPKWKEKRWRSRGWQSQWGFCKDERKVCICFHWMRWSALILSRHVRSRHDSPSRPYICILPLNRQAPCKKRSEGGRQRRERWR